MTRHRTPGATRGAAAPPSPVGPGTPVSQDQRASQPLSPFPLLTTKLYAPRPRADLVARPRLLAHLDAGLNGGRCTLLSAPAGSGKSSLLAAWLAQIDRPVAWLT